MYWLNVSGEYAVSIIRVTELFQLDAEVVWRKYCVAHVGRFEAV
jgi:hypothetical protein